MKPSLSLILTALLALFIAHSIWNLVALFRVPSCQKGETCYKSYLNSNPQLDLCVYVSDNSKSGNTKQVLSLDNFDYSSTIEKEIELQLSRTARNNGTLFVHVIVVPSRPGKDLLTVKELADLPDSTHLKFPLSIYSPPISATINLLKDEKAQVTPQSVKPVTHLRGKFGILMCNDKFSIGHNNIPMEFMRYLRVNQRRQFLPIIMQDTMQMRTRDLIEIQPDTKEVAFKFLYNPVGVGKARLMSQIEASLHQFLTLGFTEKDLDEVKGVFADTNLFLLCATILIGSIHLLLDFLSFKNDVHFWKQQTSMAGLSTSGVLWRAFSQTVVFLFLLDEGTSLIVLIPTGIGTLIEFWKVSKVMKKRWRSGTERSSDSETADELQTRAYDKECMLYLSYVLYPLCAGAAIYSLLYQSHKSWYSWTINSLVNGVYAFGFLFMLPQLFINYRLKSVAALPWRAFTYRAFNTFIDDIFAFIITMPTSHRVACFRDDAVFLVYLYQRWLYPVDKMRVDSINDELSNALESKKDK